MHNIGYFVHFSHKRQDSQPVSPSIQSGTDIPLTPTDRNTVQDITSTDHMYEDIGDVPPQPSQDPQPHFTEAQYQNSGQQQLQQPGSRDTYLEPVSTGEAHTYLAVTVCMYVEIIIIKVIIRCII